MNSADLTTNLQSQVQSQLQSQAQQQSALPWLTVTERALPALLQGSFPNRRLESWKYSSQTALQQAALFGGAKVSGANHSVSQAGSEVSPAVVEQLQARCQQLPPGPRLVFINGQWITDLSDLGSFSVANAPCRFSEANAAQQQLINTHLGASSDLSQQFFTASNLAQVSDGLLIHLTANECPDQTLQLVHFSSPTDGGQMTLGTALVVLESGAQLSLIEIFDSLETESPAAAHHQHMDIVLQANARLVHQRVQVEDETQATLTNLQVDCQRDANYQQFDLCFGGPIKRNDIQLNFNGAGAHGELSGVFLAKHSQHVDNQINLHHNQPHCTSNTEYKGFVTDNSRAVFNGRILIQPDAQKTAAHLNNKNLLLSSQAELNTKPELEIYADDVECAHGNTSGALDPNQLFYMRQRGIPEAEARALLTEAFIAEALEDANEDVHDALLDAARSFLSERV